MVVTPGARGFLVTAVITFEITLVAPRSIETLPDAMVSLLFNNVMYCILVSLQWTTL